MKSRASYAIPKLAIAVAICLISLAVTPRIAAADGFSDAFIGYRFGTDFREPFNPDPIAKNILQFQYVNGGSFGGNLLNLDILSSNGADSANNGTAPACIGCSGGAQELYAVYRHTISLGALTGHKLAGGIISNIGITGGFNYNSKQDNFTSRVQQWQFGPSVSFKVPGYASLAVEYRTEENHSAFCLPNFSTGCNVHFTPSLFIEGAYGIYFKAGLPAVFQGFFGFNTSKGIDGSGNPTAPEILSESALLWDVGSIAGAKRQIYVGVGYQYWHNKFGSMPGVGTQANVIQLESQLHL